MYNPLRFQSTDRNAAIELMDRHPFATVITTGVTTDGTSLSGHVPLISHLPLTPIRKGDEIYLLGHFAKANPHCKHVSNNTTTAIFHGPHTYITPKWYAQNDVPTWNYSVVHCHGPVDLVEDEAGLVECLKALSAHAERHWPSGWDFFIPDDLSGDVLVKSIVGFRLHVRELQFKTKLSQNRNADDRAGILRGLESRKDENSAKVLANMLQLFDNSGRRRS